MVPFRKRLKRKLLTLLVVAAAGLVLSGIIGGILWLCAPYFPDPIKQILVQLRESDWEHSREILVGKLRGSGPGEEVGFLGIQFLQVFFAPVPGQITGLLGGYVFGFWKGLALSMLGLGIGSFAAMGLTRLLGKTLARRLVNAKLMLRFESLAERNGYVTFFMIFLLPALPDDAVCLIAGLTHLRLWKLIGVCLLGRLPGIAVLTFVGSNADTHLAAAESVFAVAMVIAFLVWLFDEEVARLLGIPYHQPKPTPETEV